MKTVTQIDSAGRLVIPIELRKRYGFKSGQKVMFVPSKDGVTLIPDHPKKRFKKRGPILTIDTGAGVAPLKSFEVSDLRENHLKEKSNENRG